MLPPVLEKFPKRLRKARKARKMTQQELCERMHYNRGIVSLWECGKQMPNAEQIVVMCNTLRVSADWLLGREVRVSK